MRAVTLTDFIIVLVIAVIIGAALWYIIRAKRSGKRCVGCPDGGACGKGCSCGCGCSTESQDSDN